MATKIRHAYSPSDRSTDAKGGGKSMTRQEFTEECDINTVVERHLTVGGIITPQEFSEELVELPDNFDYKEALDAVTAADAAFLQLPADIRSAHENNPGNLLNHIESKEFQSGTVDIFGVEIRTEAPEQAPQRPEEPGTVST